MFPDTYFVFETDPAAALVEKQLENFRAKWAKVDMTYARSKNLTNYDVLTIASMIEKEVVVPRERRLVAAVIYNRLHQRMPLGIDATLRYGLDIPPTQAITKSPAGLRHAVQHAQAPRPAADPDREPRSGRDAGRSPPGEGRLPLLRPQARLPQPLLHGGRERVPQLHAQRAHQLLTGETRLVGLIGNPVAQSLSPAMQNAAFAARGLDWAYLPLLVEDGQVEDAIRGLVALGFAGRERDCAAQGRGSASHRHAARLGEHADRPQRARRGPFDRHRNSRGTDRREAGDSRERRRCSRVCSASAGGARLLAAGGLAPGRGRCGRGRQRHLRTRRRSRRARRRSDPDRPPLPGDRDRPGCASGRGDRHRRARGARRAGRGRVRALDRDAGARRGDARRRRLATRDESRARHRGGVPRAGAGRDRQRPAGGADAGQGRDRRRSPPPPARLRAQPAAADRDRRGRGLRRATARADARHAARARRPQPRPQELDVGDEPVAAGGPAHREGQGGGDAAAARARRSRGRAQVRPRRRARRARAGERPPHRRHRRRGRRRQGAPEGDRDRGRGRGARRRPRAARRRGAQGAATRSAAASRCAPGACRPGSAPMRRARPASTPGSPPR